MKRFSIRQWTVVLVEVDRELRSTALFAHFLSWGDLVSTNGQEDSVAAFVTVQLPFRSTVWIEDEHAIASVSVLHDTVSDHGVRTRWMWALDARGIFWYTF